MIYLLNANGINEIDHAILDFRLNMIRVGIISYVMIRLYIHG